MEVKRISTEAIRYSPTLNFREIFQNVGDSIRIFVSTDDLKNKPTPISERKIYGSRPYSINSDVLAIVVHMGILFRDEETKCYCKAATSFTPEKENDFTKQDTMFEAEFGLSGVIVKVFADKPLKHYPSKQRYLIQSREEDINAPFSLNISESNLATDYHKPIIFSDWTQIIERAFTPYGTEEQISEGQFPYLRSYFTLHACKFLLLNYYMIFITDHGKLLLCGENAFNLELSNIDDSDNPVVLGTISINDMSFHDTSVQFSDYGEFQVASFSVFEKELLQ